jgi:hypothetical protein
MYIPLHKLVLFRDSFLLLLLLLLFILLSFIWGAGCKILIKRKCQIVPLFLKYLYKLIAEDLHMKVLGQNPTIHTFCDFFYNAVTI